MEQVGSVDSKRALAEECIKRGLFQDAVDLYQSAMNGPLGAQDTALLHGLARAKLLAGDGAGAQAAFEALKQADPAAFNADAELDYARALALQGRTDEALRQYEEVLPRYPGEEARCRYALLAAEAGRCTNARGACSARSSIRSRARPAITAAASANGSPSPGGISTAER